MFFTSCTIRTMSSKWPLILSASLNFGALRRPHPFPSQKKFAESASFRRSCYLGAEHAIQSHQIRGHYTNCTKCNFMMVALARSNLSYQALDAWGYSQQRSLEQIEKDPARDLMLSNAKQHNTMRARRIAARSEINETKI